MSEEAKDPDAGRVERNADGSAIVTLRVPVNVGGESHSKVTIPALRGRHMMSAPNLTDATQIGELITWASKVVEPRGAVEEMHPADAVLCGNELLASLGKSPTNRGAPISPA